MRGEPVNRRTHRFADFLCHFCSYCYHANILHLLSPFVRIGTITCLGKCAAAGFLLLSVNGFQTAGELDLWRRPAQDWCCIESERVSTSSCWCTLVVPSGPRKMW